ncbi:MAG: GNAT family N-acetyltransferase [Pyrinomonadaceae bacterium]
MLLRTTLQPGDLGTVIRLHGLIYAAEYSLDHTFEGYVAAGLGEFAKTYDETKDRLWLAELNGEIVGSIAIARMDQNVAQLRWFLVRPEARGKGLGTQLVRRAVQFCREHGVRTIFLWTIGELTMAARVYKAIGFQRTEVKTHDIWGAQRTEERYELQL